MLPYSTLSTLHVPADCPSLPEALDAVRRLRADGAMQPLTIQLAAGEYVLSETIVLDNTLSLLTIEPEAGAQVSLLGGIRVHGFVPDTYNGCACLSAPLPCAADFTDVYVNGERASMTRFPAEGFLHPESAEPVAEGCTSRWFIAREGDLPVFRHIERAQVSFCHLWVDEHTPVTYDPDTRRVTMEYLPRFSIADGMEYALENIGEAFARPNDWYADNGRLYYVPRDASVTPASIEAYIPRIHKLFSVCGTAENPVRHIRIRGLHLGVTRGEYCSIGKWNVPGDTARYASDGQSVCFGDGAVSFRYAHHCVLENCTLRNFGVHGIVLDIGTKDTRLSGCSLYDGGAGGVKIFGAPAGSPAAEHTCGNTVEDCVISTCGRRYAAGCGILLIHTYNNTIAHNDIGYLYYTGISVGWVWGYAENQSHDNFISKNHIHHLGSGVLSDMGGVYLLGLQPGTVVSGNVIHDITSRNYGGWALYTDEGSSYITLENNVCYNTSDNVYHQHYGSFNTVRNNIFAFSRGSLIRLTRDEPHLSILFEQNILYSDGPQIYDITREQFTEGRVTGRNNLLFDCSGKAPVLRDFGEQAVWSLADVQDRGAEQGSVTADPLFVDPAHFNFTLRPDSPALALGFQPIRTDDAGPRR